MVKTAFFAADQDEGAQRGSGRPIPPLVSEIQAATTNTGTKPQGGLTPDFLALSVLEEFVSRASERGKMFTSQSQNQFRERPIALAKDLTI
jgi:hypothetical protein